MGPISLFFLVFIGKRQKLINQLKIGHEIRANFTPTTSQSSLEWVYNDSWNINNVQNAIGSWSKFIHD